MPDSWENRLSNLIKRYKPADTARFRVDFRDTLSRGRAAGGITTADTELLLIARERVESWASPTPPAPSEAMVQWQATYEAGRHLPTLLLQAILLRFPNSQAASVDWEPFLLACNQPDLLDVLMSRGLIKKPAIVRLAKAQPAAFYSSAALDAALNRPQFADVKQIWNLCAECTPRPAGLLSAEHALVRCYAVAKDKPADERMISFLIGKPQHRQSILALLLEQRDLAVRLCRYLVFVRGHPSVRSKQIQPEVFHALLHDWIGMCQDRVTGNNPARASTAARVVSLIRLALDEANAKVSDGGDGSLANEISQAMRRVTSRALKDGEEGSTSAPPDVAIALLGSELYRFVQEYLHTLPLEAGSSGEAPERARRFERYMGSKHLILQVLAALDASPNNSGLRDALEAALYNCDVLPLGAVGERLNFDPRAHEAESADILPEDTVEIVRPGRRLGTTEHSIVLVKAQVKAVPAND